MEVLALTDRADPRGSSFSVPAAWARFLPAAADLHVTSLRPGHIRGNHFHRTRKEIIVVIHRDVWTLHWDQGRGCSVHRRAFPGAGAVMVMVEPGAAHAVENSGAVELFTLGLTDGPYDPEDTVRVEITGRSGESGINNQP